MKPAGPGIFQRFSIVWIVPLVALLAVLAVAWQNYAQRGPLIAIRFENASGVKPGTTELRYRDVTVGMVEDVSFADGLDTVLVSVRLEKDVAPYVDDGSKFWVVRPQVTAQGVSGLDTVLSGVFIEGVWDSRPDGLSPLFDGLEQPPLERNGQRGLRLTLRAAGKASLTQSAPILYRGIVVGRVGQTSISADGNSAQAEALIFAPHDRLVNTATRFWDASGFSFSLGPNGAMLDFSSIASLVSGGITFETMISGGDPATPGTTFTVYADEAGARSSIFTGDEGEAVPLSAIFDDNIAGLTVGAPVELNGLQIGKVSVLNGVIDPDKFGDGRVRLVAGLSLRPGRLGLEGDAGQDAALDYLRGRVREGLRARLATASILTGGLKVELVQVADAPPAELEDLGEHGWMIPTTRSEIADVSATAEGVFERINALPVEELMAQAITLLDNANTLISSDETRAVPGNLNGLLSDARNVAGSEDMQALPARLNALVSEFETLTRQLNEATLAARLGKALDDASEAADSVSTAVAGMPDLVRRLDAVAAKAETVELDRMAAELTSLLDTAQSILDGKDARALPGSLRTALDEVTAVLAQLREGGVVDNANAALGSAREAADSLAAAGRDLPDLISQAQAVLARANTTLKSYDASSGVGRSAQSALREVERAAQAISSLARAIERNPNSLLTGR